MNDGKKDTKLYRDPDYQLSDYYSLETDTAAYFLTVNPAGNNLRFVNSPNNVAGNSLAPEPYFINTKSVYYKNKINTGLGLPLGEYVYSSSYDIGEGWTSNDVAPCCPLSYLFDSIYMYTGGPLASFNFAVAGNALNTRNVRVKIYNNVIDDEPMSNFTYLKKQVLNIPASYFPSPDHVMISIQPVEQDPAITTTELLFPHSL